MDSLLERLRARIAEGRPCDHPDEWLPVQRPTTAAEVARVEAQLGFRLPELLCRLYTEVGNGGFGPVFGLIPLSTASLGGNVPAEADSDLVGGYTRLIRRYTSDSHGWPTGLVPVFYCGCAVFEFVDCRSVGGSVVWFDPGSESLSALLAREPVPTFAARLEMWLAGERPW